MAAGPNIHPIAPLTPKRNDVSLATLNAGRDGSGTITPFATAGANGSVIPSVRVRTGVAAGATSTAMVCRLWHQVGGTGSWFLLDEIALASVSPTTTAAVPATVFGLTNIALGALDKLGVTQTVSEAVYYTADQGDY